MARVENSLDVDLGSHLGCSVRGAASGFPAFSVLGIKRMGGGFLEDIALLKLACS